MSRVNPATLLARLAVQALLDAGVTHVVLAPGSRSAPLAYALAAALPPERLHLRHDERAAAFTALGVGRAGGLGAVVTTSGTAAANLAPAVLEAHHGGVPLVVLTADRPPALRGTWANQTSDLQATLFAAAVRARVDLADEAAGKDPDAAAATLAAALAACREPAASRPGPVHLNLGFDDPLVPDEPDAAPPPHRTPARGAAAPGPPAEQPIEQPIEQGPRTLVIAGDGAGAHARELAEAAGWPLLAEPSSGARGGPNAVGPYRLLLDLPELAEPVERAVVLGRPTLSRPVARLLARPDVAVVIVSPHPGWPGPGRPADRIVGRARPSGEPDPGWLERWLTAGAKAQAALDRVLDAEPALAGPHVAREVAAALAPGETLVAAASNPIRDLDLAARPPEHSPRILANRGLSGIDGTLSTATGVALVTSQATCRTRVLLGDLAFLHDLNGLLAEPGRRRPDLQAVVVNDRGGGIFSLLEHGELALRGAAEAARFERLFGTPQDADIGSLCLGLRVPHLQVGDVVALRHALAAPPAGVSVLEVALGEASRGRQRDLHARIRAAIQAVTRTLRP